MLQIMPIDFLKLWYFRLSDLKILKCLWPKILAVVRHAIVLAAFTRICRPNTSEHMICLDKYR